MKKCLYCGCPAHLTTYISTRFMTEYQVACTSDGCWIGPSTKTAESAEQAWDSIMNTSNSYGSKTQNPIPAVIRPVRQP